jgi:hypothetical protein
MRPGVIVRETDAENTVHRPDENEKSGGFHREIRSCVCRRVMSQLFDRDSRLTYSPPCGLQRVSRLFENSTNFIHSRDCRAHFLEGRVCKP